MTSAVGAAELGMPTSPLPMQHLNGPVLPEGHALTIPRRGQQQPLQSFAHSPLYKQSSLSAGDNSTSVSTSWTAAGMSQPWDKLHDLPIDHRFLPANFSPPSRQLPPSPKAYNQVSRQSTTFDVPMDQQHSNRQFSDNRHHSLPMPQLTEPRRMSYHETGIYQQQNMAGHRPTGQPPFVHYSPTVLLATGQAAMPPPPNSPLFTRTPPVQRHRFLQPEDIKVYAHQEAVRDFQHFLSTEPASNPSAQHANIPLQVMEPVSPRSRYRSADRTLQPNRQLYETGLSAQSPLSSTNGKHRCNIPNGPVQTKPTISNRNCVHSKGTNIDEIYKTDSPFSDEQQGTTAAKLLTTPKSDLVVIDTRVCQLSDSPEKLNASNANSTQPSFVASNQNTVTMAVAPNVPTESTTRTQLSVSTGNYSIGSVFPETKNYRHIDSDVDAYVIEAKIHHTEPLSSPTISSESENEPGIRPDERDRNCNHVNQNHYHQRQCFTDSCSCSKRSSRTSSTFAVISMPYKEKKSDKMSISQFKALLQDGEFRSLFLDNEDKLRMLERRVYNKKDVSLQELLGQLRRKSSLRLASYNQATTFGNKQASNSSTYTSKPEQIMLLMEEKPKVRRTPACYDTVVRCVGRNILTRKADKRAFEQHYACCPPPLFIPTVTLIEIAFYVLSVMEFGSMQLEGPVPTDNTLIFHIEKRVQIWRFLLYMFLHSSYIHLIFNCLVQIVIGVPLEMVHGPFRISAIYIAGVLSGSLGSSAFDPKSYLVGAAGGVYALLAAHLSNVLLNFNEAGFGVVKVALCFVFASADLGFAIWDRYASIGDGSVVPVSYISHLMGAFTGVTVGMMTLWHYKKSLRHQISWWIAVILYSVVMTGAVLWNVFYNKQKP